MEKREKRFRFSKKFPPVVFTCAAANSDRAQQKTTDGRCMAAAAAAAEALRRMIAAIGRARPYNARHPGPVCRSRHLNA